MRLPSWLSALACLLAVGSCAPGERANAPGPAAAARDSAALVPVTAEAVHALARGGARVTLVNVWATWCQPCREEFPELLDAARARAGDGVELALVSADFPEDSFAVRRFLAEQGFRGTAYLKQQDDMPFINGLHPDWSGALPATLVLDGEGRVRAFWEGRADRARFEGAITAALAPAGADDGGTR